MAREKSSPKHPSKKGSRNDEEPRRDRIVVPRTPRVARKIVNPRGNRKGR